MKTSQSAACKKPAVKVAMKNNDEDKDFEEDKGIDEGHFKEGSGKKR